MFHQRVLRAPALGDHHPEGGFDGFAIVEFGFFYAMPYALTMSATLGARVIKIEDATGDPYRTAFGPELASTKTTAPCSFVVMTRPARPQTPMMA